VLMATLALVGVMAIGWVAWIAYDEGVRTGAAKTVPVIKADAGDIKHKPDDPGGMEVPHQDKLVFNRLAPGQTEAPVERLLPLPETPIALPVADKSQPAEKTLSEPAKRDTEIATALTPALIEPAPAQKLSPPPPPEPPMDPEAIVRNTPTSSGAPLELEEIPQSDVTAAPPAPRPMKSEAAEPPEKIAAKAPEQPAAPPPPVQAQPAIPPEAAWGVQLVSLSHRKDAETVWSRLQKANSDLLGGLELRVQTAKLKKGTFYRVQAVPLADRSAAATLCDTLKSRKQDCLVVAPQR